MATAYLVKKDVSQPNNKFLGYINQSTQMIKSGRNRKYF